MRNKVIPLLVALFVAIQGAEAKPSKLKRVLTFPAKVVLYSVFYTSLGVVRVGDAIMGLGYDGYQWAGETIDELNEVY